MKWKAWVGGALLAAELIAQVSIASADVLQSQSGQFFVTGPPSAPASPVASVLATNKEFLELVPALLVVSCERIRQTVARELNLTEPWRGRINISLYPVRSPEDPITISADQFRGGWSYRVRMPDVVERRRLMRAILQVWLVEVANRNNPGRSAELPSWLAVGLAEHLLATAEPELLFPPPRARAGGLFISRTVIAERRRDPLREARAQLTQHAPSSVQELSWPTEADFSGDTAATYRASAQLFVSELIHLNNGPACFRALLKELPRHLNWQTAFLKSFHEHFGRLLDVEKWWALQTAYFTGRDLQHTWDGTESWRKLHEALQIPAQVRSSRRELPKEEAIPLQTVIERWDSFKQTAVLRARIQQLELVRQRVSPDLAPLAESYRRLLAEYLERRDRIGTVPGRRRFMHSDMERLIEDTVRELNELDDRLKSFEHDESAPPATLAGPAASKGR